MIKCYKDENDKDGVVVEFEGDLIELTTDFTCIASKLLSDGAPFQVLVRALTTADKYKTEWKNE